MVDAIHITFSRVAVALPFPSRLIFNQKAKCMESRKTFILTALFSSAVLAATYGPFYVSSLGPSYADMTFDSDQEIEFEAAGRMANIYLAPILNTPAKIAKAIQDDYIRVVYAGGSTIADFKIKRWPSSMPVEFDKEVGSVNEQHLSPNYTKHAPSDCRPGPNGVYKVTYNTGYWGSAWNIVDDVNWYTASWVDTGMVSVLISRGVTFNVVRFCP
jgi:hypothetical protein